MSHPDTDEILAFVQQRTAGPAHVEEHLRDCVRCRDSATAMVQLTRASEFLGRESMSEVAVPPFERVRAALHAPADRRPLRAAAAPHLGEQRARGSFLEHSRLAWALVGAQLRLLPRSLIPISLLGFAAAVLLATFLPTGTLNVREHAFGVLVVLVVLVGTLTTYSRGCDPRDELRFSMPVSPPNVFVCRVVGVLGIDVLLAGFASVAVHALGGTDSLFSVLTSWFGQALLTVAIALVFAVAHQPATGALAGGLVWVLGSSSGLPWAAQLPVHSVVSALWTSSPAVLALSAILLVAATAGMRFPRLHPQP